MTTVKDLKTKLQAPSYGGRVSIEGELTFVQKMYSSKIEVYHFSYIRGGNYPILTVKTDEELASVLKKNEEYLKYKEELENKGYTHQGGGCYIRKKDQKHATLHWGEKPTEIEA